MSAMPNLPMEDMLAEMEPFLIGFLIFFLVFYLLILIFAIVSYVLSSVGLYSIAKRRGIHHPWLAWIPYGNSWILGSISDQFQYVAKGKIRNRRKWLLGISIAASILPVIMSVLITVMSLALPFTEIFGVTIGLWLATLAVAIVNAVFIYIAYYDLYSSCHPENAIMFLVLSIFISVTQPFFVFACRKKDLGMPPRKQAQEHAQELPQPENVEEEPVQEAEETAVEPQQEIVAEDDCTADDDDFDDEPTETA